MTSISSKNVLKFLNALHNKNAKILLSTLSSSNFNDVLPNGTVVKSPSDLERLHEQFFTSSKTSFSPFGKEIDQEFGGDDIIFNASFPNGGGFYRVAANVFRPEKFGEKESPIVNVYMHLGLVLDAEGKIVHIQNTLFNPDDVSAF